MENPAVLYSFLGLVAWGDLANVTIYKSKRGKLVAFSKTYPQKPPSIQQIRCRDAMTGGARLWRSMPPQTRLLWNALARQAGLRMTGYNLWQHSCWKPNLETVPRLSAAHNFSAQKLYAQRRTPETAFRNYWDTLPTIWYVYLRFLQSLVYDAANRTLHGWLLCWYYPYPPYFEPVFSTWTNAPDPLQIERMTNRRPVHWSIHVPPSTDVYHLEVYVLFPDGQSARCTATLYAMDFAW